MKIFSEKAPSIWPTICPGVCAIKYCSSSTEEISVSTSHMLCCGGEALSRAEPPAGPPKLKLLQFSCGIRNFDHNRPERKSRKNVRWCNIFVFQRPCRGLSPGKGFAREKKGLDMACRDDKQYFITCNARKIVRNMPLYFLYVTSSARRVFETFLAIQPTDFAFDTIKT